MNLESINCSSFANTSVYLCFQWSRDCYPSGAKTKIEKIQKILKKLRQGVNINLKRQIRPNIFNVNMFFLQEDI